jgi:hypothetical protein
MLASSCELREYEIVNLQTPRGGKARSSSHRRNVDSYQPLLPAGGSDRGIRSDPACVVAEGRVELGPVANRCVYLSSTLWLVARKQVELL